MRRGVQVRERLERVLPLRRLERPCDDEPKPRSVVRRLHVDVSYRPVWGRVPAVLHLHGQCERSKAGGGGVGRRQRSVRLDVPLRVHPHRREVLRRRVDDGVRVSGRQRGRRADGRGAVRRLPSGPDRPRLIRGVPRLAGRRSLPQKDRSVRLETATMFYK